MNVYDWGEVAIFIIFALIISFLTLCIGFSLGIERTLDSVQPCTKESPLVKQNVGDLSYVCNNGKWSRIDD